MKDKKYALQLLLRRQTDPKITYQYISEQTGYERKQLSRLSRELEEKDMDALLVHGNTGRQPVTTASDQEVSYLVKLKEPYLSITIAQFRDIFIEDVIENPEKQDDVETYGLKSRSKSWFRELFIRQGWETPAKRPVRTDGNREQHNVRPARSHRGELVQIDGTSFDWFGVGRCCTLHLAVDDATTEVLAGWFMETECTRGYCRMMNELINYYGIPEALYSDKDTVFVSAKGGGETEFSRMIHGLNIKTILANSSEAKGRVERYNGTCQLRLPNDLIRFKIPHDYDVLNRWFNDFYRHYLNRKFSFLPKDPRDAFIPLPPMYNASKVFRLIIPERVVRNNYVSIWNSLYCFINSDGEAVNINNGTKITIYVDALTEEMYIERYNKRYTAYKVGERKRSATEIVENQKDLNELLNHYRTKTE